MSNEKKFSLGVTANTIITILSGCVIGWVSWSNNKQLQVIGLNQDKAIMQLQAETTSRYLSIQRYTDDQENERDAAKQTSESIKQITSVLSDLRTDMAVVKSEVQKANKP